MKKHYTGLKLTLYTFTEEDILTLSASESDGSSSASNSDSVSSSDYGNDLIGKDIFKD